MPREPIDLSAHINQDVTRGNPAAFPVGLVRLFQEERGDYIEVPHRRAVARLDTGRVLSVVSDHYRLVEHQAVLDSIDHALAPLDVGAVPRGIFVDRGGARLRAVYKFPALADELAPGDPLCPCIKIQNTYDGTSRISIHIGAFRFVCTNLAVGGGGIFAGGFMSVHLGVIPLEEVAKQLAEYLTRFQAILALYRRWMELGARAEGLTAILESLPPVANTVISARILDLSSPVSILTAYNVATDYATHETRSANTAFDLLARINRGFQEEFPA